MKTLTGLTWIVVGAVLIASGLWIPISEAQTPVARPSITAMGPMIPVQIKLTGLTSTGYSWIPRNHIGKGVGQFQVSQNNPQGDVYFGQSQRDRAGKLILGTVTGGSSPQVTIKDTTGFIVANAWGANASSVLQANNTYTLDALSGTWLQGGFTITCSDGNSGVDCGKINAELFWQQ